MRFKTQFNRFLESKELLSVFPLFTLNFANTVHFWHWTTNDSNVHEVLDELYTELRILIDKLSEILIANDITLTGTTDNKFDILPKELIIQEIRMYNDHISKILENIEDQKYKTVLIEIKLLVETSIYKLKMN